MQRDESSNNHSIRDKTQKDVKGKPELKIPPKPPFTLQKGFFLLTIF